MRTTAEIVRESVRRAREELLHTGKSKTSYISKTSVGALFANLAATYACELAQADAAALLEPVRMRRHDRAQGDR